MKGITKLAQGDGHVGIMDFPEPTPGPGQVKIEVKYAGLCGSDIHVWHDEIGFALNPPMIMGHEFSGIIAENGPGAKQFKVGERVIAAPAFELCRKCDFCKDGKANVCIDQKSLGYWYNGPFAKYFIIPEAFVYHLPDNISLLAAAVMEPLSCTVHAVNRAQPQAGDVALVSGPGAIGLLTMQVARAQGCVCVVSGTDSDAKRLELAKELGAERVVNIQKEDLKAVLMEMTNGYGPDIVFECSGNQAAINFGVQVLRPASKYVQVGLPGHPINFDIEQICYKDATFYGTMAAVASDWRESIKLVASGKVKTEPLVSHQIPMTEWEKAFKLFENREGVKIVFTPVDD